MKVSFVFVFYLCNVYIMIHNNHHDEEDVTDAQGYQGLMEHDPLLTADTHNCYHIAWKEASVKEIDKLYFYQGCQQLQEQE